MKKQIALLLAVSSLLTLTACGKKKGQDETLMVEVPPLTEAVDFAETAPTVPALTEEIRETEETVSQIPETTLPPATEPAPETEAPETVPAEPQKKFDLPKGFEAVDETVYAVRKVNIRSEPAVQSDSPGQLPKGDSVKRVGISKTGWSAVIYDDQLYYIASEYLTKEKTTSNGGGSSQSQKDVTETEAPGTIYANHTVNFRKEPNASSKWLASIPYGAELKRLATCSNGWVKVSYKDQEGYVAGNYVTETAPAK